MFVYVLCVFFYFFLYINSYQQYQNLYVRICGKFIILYNLYLYMTYDLNCFFFKELELLYLYIYIYIHLCVVIILNLLSDVVFGKMRSPHADLHIFFKHINMLVDLFLCVDVCVPFISCSSYSVLV